MDIWTQKIFVYVGMAFLPVWLLAVVAGILRVRWSSRPAERRRTKRISDALLTGMVAYFLLFGAVCLAYKLAVARRFASLVKRPPDALVISSQGNSVTLSDPAAIRELLRMIDQGERVWAHHSHPVKEIHLSFPHAGYTYALGQDSQRDDEFWLKWVAYPGSGAPRDLSPVRQFRSEELRLWWVTSGRAGGG